MGDARIDAAEKALREFGVAQPGYWRRIATAALAAADAVSASECEKLKAALRDFVEWAEEDEPDGTLAEILHFHYAFTAAFAERARVLVGSAPRPNEADE